ncbi:transmembrane protein C1orf162 homolog [Sarcophilus harrisii]|uniref:transmembrane protein C1orf162 homolog n=1 Tax=Sarcophilus harrisii TaxID=9305 RepID=UPI00062BD404|nr:transmembrane protein C1orf162 homolog [Sarcophilus harrisii]XP_031823152.1 transmembrane protein C1orf162 homolog [Sarcophilus harrisii]
MGSGASKPKPTEKPQSTAESPPCDTINYPTPKNDLYEIYPYLLVAFFVGVLLTLLVTVIVCFIRKSCSKDPTRSSQQISQTSDPCHKDCSTTEEALPYVDTSLQDSEENKVYFAQHQDGDSDSIVYAKIKVQTRTSLPSNESEEIH